MKKSPLKPESPEWDDPGKAFEGIWAGLACVGDLAESYGISVVFAACYHDKLEDVTTIRPGWTNTIAAGTLIEALKDALKANVNDYAYEECDD